MQDFFPLGKWRVRATVRAISSTASTETSRQAKEGRRAQISTGGCHGHCQLQAMVGSHGLDSLEDGLLHSTCIKRQRWLNRHRKINRKGQETLSAAKKWVISHNGASWPWRLRCGGRGCARGFLLRGQTDRQTSAVAESKACPGTFGGRQGGGSGCSTVPVRLQESHPSILKRQPLGPTRKGTLARRLQLSGTTRFFGTMYHLRAGR